MLPALHRFRPDLIVVASGFDSAAHDPLGRQMLTSGSYRAMTLLLLDAADELCAGRLVVSHEGGYNPNTVPFCGLAVIEELAGIETGVPDPYVAGDVRIGQQELQPHQMAVIDQAVELVANVPVPHSC